MTARVYEVASSGGEAKLLIERVKESGNGNPFFLPRQASGRSIAFRVGPGKGSIVLKESEEDELRTLVEGGWSGAYSPSGHIVFDRPTDAEDGLWALPFALDVLQPTGEAFRITERGRLPSVSENGTLVYDIWVHDIERPAKQRLTFDSAVESRPQWSPTGRQVAFQSIRKGDFDIFRRAADGTGDAERLVEEEGDERPYGWSWDGVYLVYTIERGGDLDIRYLKRTGHGGDYESVVFLETPFNEGAPNISPDGRFIAYCSNESGENQVYVSSFPSGDGKWQVSTSGGCQPRWSPRGDEIFYVQYDTLMAAKVRSSPSFATLSTTPLFSDRRLLGFLAVGVTYDVSADGRFVMVDTEESEEAAAHDPRGRELVRRVSRPRAGLGSAIRSR